MKFSTTLIFFLLFLAVGGAFLYLNQRSASQLSQPVSQTSFKESVPAEVPSQNTPVLDRSEKITWMQIQNTEKNETVTLAREDKLWEVKYPVVYPASDGVVDEMVRTLMAAVKLRQLAPEKGWEEYGLLRPSIKIGLKTEAHPVRRYLLLGHQSEVGDSVFARWQEEKNFFLVNTELKRIFDRSLYALREKRIFRIAPAAVLKIHFEMGPEFYELVKRNDQWVWVKPQGRRGMVVDPVSAEEFSSHLRDLFIKDFLDEQKEKIDASFFKTAGTITVWGSGRQKEIFYLGQEAPVRDAFYGRRNGENGILLIDRGILRALLDTVRNMGSGVVVG